MTKNALHFDKNIWIEDNVFHCAGMDYDLNRLQKIHVNFRVNTTIAAFLLLIFTFFGLGYGYFYYGDSGYIMLVPLVTCFWFLRYMLHHYVELYGMTDGHWTKMLVVGMRHRQQAYDVEDALRKIIAGHAESPQATEPQS